MSSNDFDFCLDQHDEQTLLDVAVASIEFGLENGRPLDVDAARYSESLQALRASFVTLRIAGELRGCMGAIRAIEPLVDDVAQNAYAAAFRDPRFSGLKRAEAENLDIYISVLTPPEPLQFDSEADLLAKMRPGVDGLILYEGKKKGTLLPAVWENIPNPVVFLEHLKQKAGLSTNYWSETIRVDRYRALSIGHE